MTDLLNTDRLNGAAVREWRGRLGLTQEAAGKAVGVSTATWRQYEYERHPISQPVAKLMRYIEAFGAEPPPLGVKSLPFAAEPLP